MVLKLYPDHVPARVPRIAGDMLAAAWCAVWAAAGLLAYQTVMALQVVADGLSSTGHTFNSWIDAFRSAAPKGIPILSPLLERGAAAFEKVSGDPMVSAGAQAHTDIFNLAVATGLFTALPPILIGAGAYGLWRWRDAREMGSALAFVRAAESGGRTDQAKAVLAYRAVASLSFRSLMKISADPIGDLAAHRYDALAAEMLKKAGLESFRLYDAGSARLEPGAAGVRGHRQQHHQHRPHPDRQVRALGPGGEDS